MTAPQKLTQRQLLFWLGQQRQAGAPVYNMVVEFDLRGSLDRERLLGAFREIVRRSDAMRSVFREGPSGVVREVREDFETPLSFVDLSSEADPATRLAQLLREAATTDFDLGVCCFQAGLVRMEPERHVLFIVQHHLIGDGASIRLLYTALMALYQDQDPGPIGSASLALSQQQAYLESPRAAADADYWSPRRQLRREPTKVFVRSESHSDSQISRVEVKLGEGDSAALRSGGVEGGGVFPDLAALVLLETIVLAYLHRVTGQREQALGTPVRNRQGRAGRTAVGCFIEVVPIQAEVEPTDTFLDLLGRVRTATMDALAHGQHCVSNPDDRPLFDVTVNYHVEQYQAAAGLTVEVRFWTGLHAFKPKSRGAHLPGGDVLAVHCHDYAGSGRLTLWLDFHALHFDAAQRAQATNHIVRLLQAALADPSQRIIDVDLIDHEERRHIVELAKGRTVEVVDRTFLHEFEEQVRLQPERAAVSFNGETWSYAQLSQKADRVAAALALAGVPAEAPVAVLMDRSPALLAAILGVFKAGAACVPLDPTHPANRIAHIIEVAKPAFVVSERSHGQVGPEGTRVLCFEDLPEAESTPLPIRARPEGIAYILFTSGSSGKPKGVQVEHRALSNFLASMRREPGLTSDDRVLALTTVTFDIATLELYLPLTCGACIELLDEATATNPAHLRRAIDERQPTLVQATPTGFRLLREAGWSGESVRAVVGGEPLPPDLAEWLSLRAKELWNAYGPTETTVWSTLKKIDPHAPFPITIGRPIDNTTCFVLNEARRLAPIGVPGELYIGGSGLARGYHGDPTQTAAKFVTDAPGFGPRLYRTGDLAVLRPDGELECLGRADFQLKIRGFRIEPGDIEHALGQHEGVAACVVVGRDAPGGKVLAAYVVARPGVILDADTLRKHLAALLPPYMVPATFTFLLELPRTPSGKIDRKALPAPEVGFTDDDDGPVSLRSDLEMQVAAAFEEVLKQSPIGRYDDFFDLGGHSLLALDLNERLDAIAGRPLGIGLIFEFRRVSELAAAIAAGGGGDGPIIMPLNRGATGVPLFCMRGVHIYRDLAAALGPDQRVIGIHLPAEERLMRVDGGDETASVKALARAYIDAMKRVAPVGPYRVGGVSFAGVLAYEVTQQLLAAGEDVEFLALFDTVLPRGMVRKWIPWAGQQAAKILRARSVRHLLKRVAPRRSQAEADEEGWKMKVFAAAVRTYEPRMQPLVKPCRVLLFRADDRPSHPGYLVRPDLGWGELVRDLATEPVPGDHLALLQPPVVERVAGTMRKMFGLEGQGAAC